jgi:hypothetical protein
LNATAARIRARRRRRAHSERVTGTPRAACSVVPRLAAAVGACRLPPPHELDPVQGGPLVPALDENRASEARRSERLLSALAAPTGCSADSAYSVSPFFLHNPPLDAQTSRRLTSGPPPHRRSPPSFTEPTARSSRRTNNAAVRRGQSGRGDKMSVNDRGHTKGRLRCTEHDF